MNRIKEFIDKCVEVVKNVIEFLTYDIWRLDFSKPQRFSQNVIRRVKVVILTLSRFLNERIGRESVFLSFYSVMAFVPMVATALFIMSGVGMDNLLMDMLQPYFADNERIVTMVLGWARNIIDETHKGLFGITSAIAFLWIIIWLMISVENTFNVIWKTEKKRGFFKNIGLSMIIILILPFVFTLFLFIVGYFTHFIDFISHYKIIKFFASRLYWIAAYGLAVLVLSAMYKFIPHVKIKYKDCFRSALVAGLIFMIVQYLYLGTQVMVTRLSGVYGAIAAIPLLMIWLNLSWQSILFGTYLTYSYQHVDDFNPDKETLFNIKARPARERARRRIKERNNE